jgi:hypothetical protein
MKWNNPPEACHIPHKEGSLLSVTLQMHGFKAEFLHLEKYKHKHPFTEPNTSLLTDFPNSQQNLS